ncbi:succinate dehydrogenase/fumarate reductase iron-sulfur subunit [Arcobacter sp. FWKO B]|uniref:succinate dehydrogenase/fumarate reductase iron-sulfur subunit n=1 Tax=Arcobacter sp. FWKO B TaxID=2593672 RepID=UPI0018A35612|nr:2Fe-2S iron-sulfur cluster-binding protein [Arcobacter sp. FWKO B]QOG12226.1 4Fe-4S dicluster domain-containing protein [Arcobacter sp. FWKO B]
MKLTIIRDNKEQVFEIPDGKYTVLEGLRYIKINLDRTLSFNQGCRSGVCGSCACIVGDKEVLSCKTFLNDGDVLKPLKNLVIIKDLVVSKDTIEENIKKFKTTIIENSNNQTSNIDVKKIDIQSNCILCQSCYSSCPVFSVNKDFAGPYILSRVLRYTNDKKEANQKAHIDLVQENGVWDCTLCGNCTLVCPEHLDPKNDIQLLRNISATYGYMDPNFASMSFSGGLDFTGNQNGFGFNPNF